jgi:hypothetical protein
LIRSLVGTGFLNPRLRLPKKLIISLLTVVLAVAALLAIPKSFASGRELTELQVNIAQITANQNEMRIAITGEHAAKKSLLDASNKSLTNLSEPMDTMLSKSQETQKQSEAGLESASTHLDSATSDVQEMSARITAMNRTIDNILGTLNEISVKLPVRPPRATRRRGTRTENPR